VKLFNLGSHQRALLSHELKWGGASCSGSDDPQPHRTPTRHNFRASLKRPFLKSGMETPEGGASLTESFSHGERPSKRRRTTSVPLHREVGLMRSVPGDKFSGFVGSASGIYFIRSVYSALQHPSSTAPTSLDTPVNDVVPGEDDQLPAPKQLWKDNELSSSSDTVISYQDLIELSGSYFANW